MCGQGEKMQAVITRYRLLRHPLIQKCLRLRVPESNSRATLSVELMPTLPLPGLTKTCTTFVVAAAVATRARGENTKTIHVSG